MRVRTVVQTHRDPEPSATQSTAHDLKHSFTVEPVESSFGGPREFLSHCVRCKWTFRVNLDRGSIVPCDNNGEPLEDPEASRRIDTFAEGPCPAIDDSHHDSHDARDGTDTHPGFLERLQPVLHALGFDRIH